MAELKLLNKSFNIADIRHVPTFLEPYSFVVSMPHRLSIICTEEDTPEDLLSTPRHCSCFVVENESVSERLVEANTLISLLAGAGIDVQMMSTASSVYLFVDTDNAMTAIMLLSSNGYDVVYTDLI